MQVAAYLRCSTKTQVGEGKYGLDSKRADIATFCMANGYQIAAEFIDAGVSGTKTDRPGFIKLLEAAKRKEFAAVIVGKGDRLARMVKVDGYLRVLLETYGVHVLSATERNAAPNDDDGEMIEGMLAVVAQRVRKDIVKRLATARKVKAKAGGYAHGSPPYGYRAENASLVEVEDEQRVIRTIVAMRNEGSLLKQIVAHLNDAAVPTRNGKEWQISTVAAIIKRTERHRPSARATTPASEDPLGTGVKFHRERSTSPPNSTDAWAHKTLKNRNRGKPLISKRSF